MRRGRLLGTLGGGDAVHGGQKAPEVADVRAGGQAEIEQQPSHVPQPQPRLPGKTRCVLADVAHGDGPLRGDDAPAVRIVWCVGPYWLRSSQSKDQSYEITLHFILLPSLEWCQAKRRTNYSN